MVTGQPAVPGFEASGHASQISPLPSPSESSWTGLAMLGQLSLALVTPSPSASFGSTDSQASPTPFALLSSWLGFATLGQLSAESGTPSPSVSTASGGVVVPPDPPLGGGVVALCFLHFF